MKQNLNDYLFIPDLFIHTIWAGPFPQNPHVLRSIEAFRRKFGSHYRLWCFSELSKDKLLNPYPMAAPKEMRAFVKYLDYDEGTPSPYSILIESDPRWASILSKLKSLKAYTAIKDICQFAILYLYGGYYLDLSADITEAVDYEEFKSFIADKKYRLVRLNYSGRTTGRELYECNGPHDLPMIDVWMAYGDQYENFFLHLLKILAAEWSSMLIVRKGNERYVNTKLQDLAGRLPPGFGGGITNIAPREGIIGGTIVNSVYSAIGATLDPFAWKSSDEANLLARPIHYESVRDLIYDTFFDAVVESQVRARVRHLNIVKTYQGSWRDQHDLFQQLAEKYPGALTDFNDDSR